jgi:hypothetical protein
MKGLATDAVVAGFQKPGGWLLIAVERAVHGCEGVGLRTCARRACDGGAAGEPSPAVT